MIVDKPIPTIHESSNWRKLFTSPKTIIEIIEKSPLSFPQLPIYTFHRALPDMCNFCLEQNHPEIFCELGTQLFHVTDRQSYLDVLSTNLKQSMHGRLGKGVYFGSAYVVYQFCRQRNFKDPIFFKAKVLIGKQTKSAKRYKDYEYCLETKELFSEMTIAQWALCSILSLAEIQKYLT